MYNYLIKAINKLQKVMKSSDRFIISKDQDRIARKLARDVEEYIVSHNIIPNTKLLFIPRYYQISYIRLMDIFWVLSLRLRGVEIVPVLCDKFLPQECVVYGGNYSNERASLCGECDFISKKIWIDVLGAKPLFLSDFIKKGDDEVSNEVAAKVDFGNYKEMTYKGYHLGIEAARVVANLNDNSMIEDKQDIIQQLRIHTKNIVNLMNAYEAIYNEVKPEAVLSNIPFYYHWGVALNEAGKRNIPFYGIGLGERKNTSYFVYNSGKIYDFDEGWNSFKNKEFDDNTKIYVDKIIYDRSQGKHFSLPHYKESKKITEEYKKMTSWVNNKKKLVLFPVNVPSDATILGGSSVFDNLFEMIKKIVHFFNNHPHYQLIIKAHPAEEQFYSGATKMQKYCLKNVLSNLEVGENIYFIDYDSPIASFDIYPLIDLGIMYTSSTAIEMAWIGKPSITAAQSHYSGKGFIYEPKDENGYYDLIEKILSEGEPENVVKKRIELSKKYFYYYFFNCLIDFHLFQGDDYNSIPTKFLFEDVDSILPGKNRQLDYICESIINKLPVYGENRWPPRSLS